MNLYKKNFLKSPYVRDGVFSINFIIPKILSEDDVKRIKKSIVPLKSKAFKAAMMNTVMDKPVNMSSQRLQLFASNKDRQGIVCVGCGVVGVYFALERHCTPDPFNKNDVYHLNLYGLDADGEERLLTKDHIKAVKKGGINYLNNYQTMCFQCNQRKGTADSFETKSFPVIYDDVKVMDRVGNVLEKGCNVRMSKSKTSEVYRIESLVMAQYTVLKLSSGHIITKNNGGKFVEVELVKE